MLYRLLTPGPTSVPPQVISALAEPVAHHRTAEFRAILQQVQVGLRRVFQTTQDVCIITGSGTAAFEAGLTTVVRAGARVLNIDSGRFARRWGDMARHYGIAATDATFEDGTHVTPDRMTELLAAADYDAVLITHSETSTATACDLAAVAQAVHACAPDALLIVDGITSIGAMPFYMDQWGVDVAVTGSQKALMAPPGLGFVALSERAWKAAEQNDSSPAFYLDLKKYREAAKTGDTPFTPAIPLVKAVAVSLGMLQAEGIEQAWKRTRVHAEMTRRGMSALGLELLSRMPADSVTALRYPAGIDDRFRGLLARDHNLHVAGGQGGLQGRIFRVNHMGHTDVYEALACIAATEHVLRKLGHPVELGRGVTAAQQAIGELL